MLRPGRAGRARVTSSLGRHADTSILPATASRPESRHGLIIFTPTLVIVICNNNNAFYIKRHSQFSSDFIRPGVVSGGSKCVRNVSGRDEESARNIVMALIDSQVRGQDKVSLNHLFPG